MNPHFRIIPLDKDFLNRIRERGHADFGNPLVPTANADEGGTPLRCCLREAGVGERVALIAYQPASIGGPYAEVGPVFIHADECSGYDPHDVYPEEFRHRTQILRAYDRKGCQLDNQIVDGVEVEARISELLARVDVAFIHSRNVLAGCYMFGIVRSGVDAQAGA